MKIPLESANRSGHPAYHLGRRKRLATCTSVRFLDRNTLVCASLVGQWLYRIRFDVYGGTWEVTDRVDTCAAGKPVCTDLLDYDGDSLLATSNCEKNSVTLYHINDNGISHYRDLPILNSNSGYCHGVAFIPSTDLIATTSQTKGRFVFLTSISRGSVIYYFGDGDWIPKDVTFLGSNRALVAYSMGHASREINRSFGSKIELVTLARDYRMHKTEASWVLDIQQIDSIRYSHGEVVFTDQAADCVHRYRFDGSNLLPVDVLRDYDFPHGLDYGASRRLLAVTNYGSNCLDIRFI